MFIKSNQELIRVSQMRKLEKDIISLVFRTNEYIANRLERVVYQWTLKFTLIRKQIKSQVYQFGYSSFIEELDKLKFYFLKMESETILLKRQGISAEEIRKSKSLIALLIGQIRILSQNILSVISKEIDKNEMKIMRSQRRTAYLGVLLLVHLVLFSLNSFLPIKEITRPLSELVKSIQRAKNIKLDATLNLDKKSSKIMEISVLKDEYNQLLSNLKEAFDKLNISIENEKNAKLMTNKSYVELEASYKKMETLQNELAKALKSAKEASVYKTEFLANMSHEIRTPLTAILGYNELMLDDDNLTEDQKENMMLVHKSGERLMYLLMDILEISKIEANKSNITKKDTDLEFLCKELSELNALKLKGKGIYLTFNLNGIKKIYTDYNRLEQILLNLIGNAIKFTNEGGIKVEVSKKEDKYFFSVTDTGIGIKEELVGNVFDSFVTGEMGLTKKYEGTGLGLNICKRLVELLGGEIWVESSIGKGSTFYFTLSCEINTHKASTKKAENLLLTNAGEVKSLNIAVVDDEALLLRLITKTISEKTVHSVNAYSSCIDFLKDFKEGNNFDLIYLDIRMPDINGIECLKKLRKINNKTPVIALTAFALEGDREKFIGYGFNDFVSKPVEIIDFISKINEYAS
jgi:signal transduction histidine kinase